MLGDNTILCALKFFYGRGEEHSPLNVDGSALGIAYMYTLLLGCSLMETRSVNVTDKYRVDRMFYQDFTNKPLGLSAK